MLQGDWGGGYPQAGLREGSLHPTEIASPFLFCASLGCSGVMATALQSLCRDHLGVGRVDTASGI